MWSLWKNSKQHQEIPLIYKMHKKGMDNDPRRHLKVKIHLKLNTRALEYPKDKLNSYAAIGKMNKQASANLNERSKHLNWA
nr:hypothetical protein [Bacillus sp. JFL15]